jgi:hypothetical protein
MLPRLTTGLGLLSAASIGTVLLIPVISGGRGAAYQPYFGLIASIGVVLIVLTSLFLAYASRVMGLGLAWFLWALIDNGCIIATKFIVSPTSLYRQPSSARLRSMPGTWTTWRRWPWACLASMPASSFLSSIALAL